MRCVNILLCIIARRAAALLLRIGIVYYTIYYYIRIPLRWLRVYKCGVSTYIGSLVTRVTVAGAVCVCVCVYHLPRIY